MRIPVPRLTLLLPAVLLAVAPARAQTSGSRPAPIVSPEVGPDRRVTFRIKGPKASAVSVSASVGTLNPKPAGAVKDQPGMWTVPLQKDAGGLWTLTLGPLEPDVYRYVFFVDGVRAIDEANPNVRPGGAILWSYFEVVERTSGASSNRAGPLSRPSATRTARVATSPAPVPSRSVACSVAPGA